MLIVPDTTERATHLSSLVDASLYCAYSLILVEFHVLLQGGVHKYERMYGQLCLFISAEVIEWIGSGGARSIAYGVGVTHCVVVFYARF